MGGKRKKLRQERVGSLAADPDDLENREEAADESQHTQGLSKNCTSRESVFPLTRLTRDSRNKLHRFPFGRINASGIE